MAHSFFSGSMRPSSTGIDSFHLAYDFSYNFSATIHRQGKHSYNRFYARDFNKVWHIQLGFGLSYFSIPFQSSPWDAFLFRVLWDEFERFYSFHLLFKCLTIFNSTFLHQGILILGFMDPITTEFFKKPSLWFFSDIQARTQNACYTVP